jgi:lipoate-protein ligase B
VLSHIYLVNIERIHGGSQMSGLRIVRAGNVAYSRDRIVPCGIGDAGVTSLTKELGRDVPVTRVLPVVEKHLAALLALQQVPA